MSSHTSDDNISSAANLILVDFSAKWCTPCKMLKPILDEIANENNNIKVITIDIDENPQISMRYKVKNIPTILILKNGHVVDEITGFMPKEEIEEYIQRNL